MDLPAGLYEALLSNDRSAALEALEGWTSQLRQLDDESASQVLTHHLQVLLLGAQ